MSIGEGVPVCGSESLDEISGTLGGTAAFDEAGRMLNLKQSFLLILRADTLRIPFLERLHFLGGNDSVRRTGF